LKLLEDSSDAYCIVKTDLLRNIEAVLIIAVEIGFFEMANLLILYEGTM
jgi:hypothetical protein